MRLVQDLRKQTQGQFTDRIRIYLVCDFSDLNMAIEEHTEYITAETLAISIELGSVSSEVQMQAFEIGDHAIQLGIEVISGK